MTPRPVVEAYGVRLRPFRAEDSADVVDGCADPLTQRFVSNLPTPYTETDARWWIDVGAPAAWTGGGAAYAIADPATDRLLGAVGLSNPVPARGQLEIGYWMRPAARGRGLATAATRALSEHAFATGTARLELLTEPENGPSQRVALAAGFRYEGLRRSAGASRDAGRHDLLAWVRVAGDPPGPVARLLPDLPDGVLTDQVVALRPLAPDDAALMYRLHSRPEVVANQAPPVPPTREAIERRCRLAQSGWLTGEIARLLITDVASGEPVGSCGLSYTDVASRRGVGRLRVAARLARPGVRDAGGPVARRLGVRPGRYRPAVGRHGAGQHRLASGAGAGRVSARGPATRPSARAGRHPAGRSDLRAAPHRPPLTDHGVVVGTPTTTP